MFIFGGMYVMTIVILFFKKEIDYNVSDIVDVDEEDLIGEQLKMKSVPTTKVELVKKKLSLFKAYKFIWHLIMTKPIQRIALILITCKVYI